MKFVTVLSISLLVFQLYRRIGSPSIIKYIKASTKSFPPAHPISTFSWTPNLISNFVGHYPIPMYFSRHLTRFPCCWDTLTVIHVFVTPCISLCKVYYPMLLIFQELMFQPIPTPHLNSQGRTNP